MRTDERKIWQLFYIITIIFIINSVYFFFFYYKGYLEEKEKATGWFLY